MTTFSVGEEVFYDGERFVVAAKSGTPPYRYRLLASTPKGARFVWADHVQLRKIESYTRARDDTEAA